MGMSRSMLACWGGSPPLLDLVTGTAANLNLEFCEFSSIEQVRALRGADPSIVVMAVPALSESLLATLKSASSLSRTWFIVVMINASSQDEDRVIEAGAVACFDPSQTMTRLAYLIRNLLKCARSRTDGMLTELRVSDDVTLRIPEYAICDGQRSRDLTPITGRLLECLAMRTDKLTPSDELKRFAWGALNGVEDHALHQQMRRLREALIEFGIDGSLRCLRGRGYVLAREKTGEPNYQR